MRSVHAALLVFMTGCGGEGSYPRLVVAEDIWDAAWIAVISDDPRERTKLDTARFAYHQPGTAMLFDRDPSEEGATLLEVMRSPRERLGIFTRYDDWLCILDDGLLCTIMAIEWGDHDAVGNLIGWDVFEMRLSDPPAPIGSPDLNGYQWWKVEVSTTLLDLVFKGDALRVGVEVELDSWYGRGGAYFVSVTGEYARRE